MKTSSFVRALLLSTIPTTFAFAQTTATDIQELKAKLQQLEGMVHSLQAQIAAVEQGQKAASKPSPPTPAAPPTAPLLPTTYIGRETRTNDRRLPTSRRKHRVLTTRNWIRR